MSAVRNDLLAVNHLRYSLTFGESSTNPFRQYESFVTRSPSQLYALILFSDFLSLSVNESPNIIDPSGVCWMHYEQVNISGAIRYHDVSS